MARKLYPVTLTERRCDLCGEVKPAAEFSPNSRYKGGLRPRCKACTRLTRDCHGERAKAAAKAGRAAPQHRPTLRGVRAEREAIREATRAWRQWLETAPAWWRAAYDAERERVRARRKYWANPAKARRKVIAYKAANPRKVAAQHGRRGARIAAQSDGTVTRGAVTALLEMATHCPFCGEELGSSTLEHLEPVSKGGPHSMANLTVCCARCNASKGGRNVDEWLSTMPAARRQQVVNTIARHLVWPITP